MKKTLACGATLIALGLAAPLKAERVYVPVVDAVGANGKPLTTQLWISNFDGVERSYSSVFLKSEADGTGLSGRGPLNRVPANKAAYLRQAADEGETGLLEVDATDLSVNAWIKTSRGARTFYTGVPVISDATRVEAGGATFLNGLTPEAKCSVIGLSLVNLGSEAASCQVDFLRADGTALGAGVAADVPSLSMRPFADALGLGSEPEARSARVSCDQPFYAYAVAVDRGTSEVSFATPEEAFTAKVRQTGTKATGGAPIVFTQNGLFHSANKETPKKILRVPVPRQLAMESIEVEFDVVAGPWNPRQKSGAHNLLFLHRGRFRSNTIANINALGPNKFLYKINQNLDMPAKSNTKAEAGYTFEHGKTYHVRVVQNALTRTVLSTLSYNGQVVRHMSFTGSVRNAEIMVLASGLVAEFGNYNNQHLPEVSSLGWKFMNFKATLIPK
jgi:hypothetical protein